MIAERVLRVQLDSRLTSLFGKHTITKFSNNPCPQTPFGGSMHNPRLFSSFLLLGVTFCLSINAAAQGADRARLGKEIASLQEQLRAKEAQFLEPSSKDKAAF